MDKCLGCYQVLEDSKDFHLVCSRKLFGTEEAPQIDFGYEDLEDLAKQALSRHLGVTGVQPKVVVRLQSKKNDPKHRMLIIGIPGQGNLILKPSPARFPELAQIEDVTMHMASAAGIVTARHGLIRLKSGELAYITRRFDRGPRGKKIPVEDFCQLSGFLTERKYKTSMEKAGKIILRYSSAPGLDVLSFFDLTLFSFLTGNADMHLKNFSLVVQDDGQVALSPAYDLISTRILPLSDAEEMALTVNGKKSKLRRADFEAMGRTLEIPEKVLSSSFVRMERAGPDMLEILQASFLSPQLKKDYANLIKSRRAILSKLK